MHPCRPVRQSWRAKRRLSRSLASASASREAANVGGALRRGDHLLHPWSFPWLHPKAAELVDFLASRQLPPARHRRFRFSHGSVVGAELSLPATPSDAEEEQFLVQKSTGFREVGRHIGGLRGSCSCSLSAGHRSGLRVATSGPGASRRRHSSVHWSVAGMAMTSAIQLYLNGHRMIT